MDFAQDVGGYLSIERRCFQLLVAEQNLDQADVDFLLQQVGGERVARRVHRNAFLDAGLVRGLVDGTIELPGTELTDRVQAGKQPIAWRTASRQKSVVSVWETRQDRMRRECQSSTATR